MTPRDAREAIAVAEGAVCQRILLGVDGIEVPTSNAYGAKVVVEPGSDVGALLGRSAELTKAGERVAVVAAASDLLAARRDLARVSAQRVGLVVHCLPDPPGAAGIAGSTLALGDLPWGVLVAVGAAESLDLSLVARRAAEDSGCPFIVVHERSVRRRQELLIAPTREMADAFLGGPRPPAIPEDGVPTVADRAPFALASAMREMESLSVHRLDVLDRAPASEATLGLVGFGTTGEAMIAEVERLRAAGHDVVAVRLVAWRPFPGPRLVKTLGRAAAVSVVDATGRPLANGGPLAVELKAAFSDALTWAPGYPGIGRMPHITSSVCPPGHDLSSADVDALVENMLADERGLRTFTLDLRRPTH
jgi:pyruvate-ferredoxin/flavodoxin oxidoreductase